MTPQSQPRSDSRKSKTSYKSRYLNKQGSSAATKTAPSAKNSDLLNVTVPISLQISDGVRCTTSKNITNSRRTKGSLIDLGRKPQNFVESIKISRPGTGFAGKTSLINPSSAQSEIDNRSVNSRFNKTTSSKFGMPLAPSTKSASKALKSKRGTTPKLKMRTSP